MQAFASRRVRRRSWAIVLRCWASAVSAVCALALPGRGEAAPEAADRMVPLGGGDDVFMALGSRSFPRPGAECFDAVLRTFRNTGHGVDRKDPEAGTIVSGKALVHQGTAPASGGGTETLTVSNKFYVAVRSEAAGCQVRVLKLRAWVNAVEVETRTQAWVATHLRSFMRGVEQELSDLPGSTPPATKNPARGAL